MYAWTLWIYTGTYWNVLSLYVKDHTKNVCAHSNKQTYKWECTSHYSRLLSFVGDILQDQGWEPSLRLYCKMWESDELDGLRSKSHRCCLCIVVPDNTWEKPDQEEVWPIQLSQKQCHRHREHPGGAGEKVRSSTAPQEVESLSNTVGNVTGHGITEDLLASRLVF